MSKDETDTHLRYGQGVIIKGYKPQKDEGQGFMTVRGFADIRANYETISDILFFKNYRNAIFEFLPAGNFQINDELFKLQSKAVDKQNQAQIKRAIQTLEARAKSQVAQFELSIKRNKKATIKFGDYIMLRHIDSETYLTGTIRPSDGTNGAFSVQVSNRLSASLVFQLLPYRSFESESMEIPFSSPVLIKNVYNNGFLTFQKLGIFTDLSHLNNYMKKVPTHSHESYRIPVKTSTVGSQVFQVVTHFIDLSIQSTIPMPWQFQIHFKQVENNSLIQHDIVYLRHTENNGILSAEGENIILKQSKDESSEGLNFYQSLWEIEKHNCEKPNVYILRHLMSGMTLGINLSNDQPEAAVLIDISNGPGSELGTVELELAKKDGGDINSESFIYVRCGEYILDVTEDEEQQQQSAIRQSKMVNTEQIINFKKMKKLMKNQLEYNVRRLKFSRQISKNCFVIQEIQDDLKKQLLFALSFHSTIINLKQDLKWGATDAMKKVSYIRMMKVTEKIQQINDFLKGCDVNDPEKQFKQPIFKRQMICKDLGLSQLLFQLLFYIRQNMKQEIFKQKVNEREKFYEMHETIYKVIINLIKNNKVFKIHVSKWILFVIEDFIEKGQPIHCEALMEILKDNQFFVENFVNHQLVQYFLHHMIKEKNTKIFNQERYINVLRAFCIVGDKVCSSNQGLILKSFIEKLESIPGAECYQLKFRKNGETIVCVAGPSKNKVQEYKFEQFKQICQQTDGNGHEKYSKSWEYYTAYLNLLADLTKGRSKSIEKYVAKQLPLSMLSELFEQHHLEELEVPIIKIIHYLYAENENFYPIDKINRIVAYDAIQSSQITINHFTGPESPWGFMEKILIKLINKLSEAGPILPGQVSKNEILYQLLKLTNQTLNLGFWLQREDLQKIFTNIINILKKHPMIYYEEAIKINRQNNLMIQCKMECLNIIDMIIDQDTSIGLQIINKVFREFETTQSENANFFRNLNSLMVMGQSQVQFAIMFIEAVDEKSKEIRPIVDASIYDDLIQLSNYQNAALTCKSLYILNRILDSKTHLIKNFFSELFVCEPSCVMFAEFLTNLKNKFFILQDINTTKITYENQNENYFNVYFQQEGQYRQNSQSGIMQDMYMITELIKNENSLTQIDKIPTLDQSGVFQKLGTQRLINFTSCRKSSSLMKQKIVDATNIHLKILKYITNCSQIPDSELALKLLHLCYFIIVALIENHQQMKPKIMPFLPYFLKHINQNVGCIDLLKQLYDNNKNMLYNENEIYSLIRSLCDQINKEQNLLYKAKLLDFFRYLIYLNNKCLRNNQIQILKIMQDDDYSSILEPVTSEKVRNLVSQYQEDNGYGKFQNGVIKCQPQLIYLSAYFQILTSLIDNNNTVNIGKLIKRFPFQLLNDCISAAQDCWMLKRNIRAVINRMYYFSVGTNVYLSIIIDKQIPTIIHDLDSFILIKSLPSNQVQFLQNLTFENPVRFSFVESYFYLNLQENLFTLYSMFNTHELYEQLEKFIKSSKQADSLRNNLIKIAQRLGVISRYFKKHNNIHTTAIIKFLHSILAKMLMSINVQFYEPGLKGAVLNSGESDDGLTEQQRAKNFIIQKIINAEIQQFYTNGSEHYKSDIPLSYRLPNKSVQIKMKHDKDEKKLSSKLREIFTKKKKQYLNRDQQANSKMDKIVSSLKMSKEVKRSFVTIFQEQLVRCYENTSAGNKQLLKYLSILIKINQDDPEAISQQLKIFILQVVISLFYKANTNQVEKEQVKQVKMESSPKQIEGQSKKEEQVQVVQGQQGDEGFKEIDEWEAQDWEKNQRNITNLQRQLKKCGFGTFLTSLIKSSKTNNVTLANNILLCSISYMLGGNRETQDNIREQLNKDSQNKILMNLKMLINKLGGLIRKNIDEEKTANKKEQIIHSEFVINQIDNYDYYDTKEKFCTRKNVSQPHYVDEIIYYQQCIVTYRRAFKFLQLLCENNNIDNKNFIREQPDTSESIDFIEIATKQLRNIFQVFCPNIVEVPLYILDFILEVTQIPVQLNQDALIKSSFFEDVCLFANEREKQSEEVQKLYDEIFNKCVKIILSNFEGNSQAYFLLLDEKLDPRFLVNILRYGLNGLSIKTKQDFNQYIEKMSEPKAEKGSKLSAQTTFNEQVSSILQIMIIFMKLRDVVGEKSKVYTAYLKQKSLKQKEGKVNEELFSQLENCLLNIQISDEKGNRQNVYFPKHPFFNSISDGLKDYVMSEVNRETHREKIISLLGFVDGIRQKIGEAYNFEKCENISQDVMKGYYQKASQLSLVICLYISLFYTIYIEYGTAQFSASWPVVIIRFVLSLFQVKYSLLFIYTWYKLNVWIKPERKSRQSKQLDEIKNQIVEDAIEASQQIELNELEPKTKFTKFLEASKEKFNEKVNYLIGVVPQFGTFVNEMKQLKQSILPEDGEKQTLQGTGQFYKNLIFVVVSLAAAFYYPPLIFIHIIDRVCNNETLGNIFKAIGIVVQQLFIVSVMGVAFVFVFNSITFSNYVKDVYGDTKDPDQMCNNPIGCVLALYVSGVIGETMDKFQITRFIYDMIYAIFFGMLFGNIISGFMLDAFDQLGSKTQELDNDKSNFCYICNISREKLEKNGDKFQSHISTKHHLWNYIFYIISLQEKNQTDYTGIEYYISQKYNLPDEQMDVTWIPNGQDSTFEKEKFVSELLLSIDSTEASTTAEYSKVQAKIDEFKSLAQSL